MKSYIAAVIGIWFALVVLLGADGKFSRPIADPPLPIFLGFSIPLIAFAGAYAISVSFRKWVLTLDLRLLTAIQAWRAGGLGFISLYAHGLLPGLFAWPAGLGDIAIGVTAPWMMLALIHRNEPALNRRFVMWNLLGILDLVNAVGMGALNSGFIPALASKVTTAPMTQLPLVLIPAFLVPLFIMLHITSLLQARRGTLRQGQEANPHTQTLAIV
jgi:hypothetical protein